MITTTNKLQKKNKQYNKTIKKKNRCNKITRIKRFIGGSISPPIQLSVSNDVFTVTYKNIMDAYNDVHNTCYPSPEITSQKTTKNNLLNVVFKKKTQDYDIKNLRVKNLITEKIMYPHIEHVIAYMYYKKQKYKGCKEFYCEIKNYKTFNFKLTEKVKFLNTKFFYIDTNEPYKKYQMFVLSNNKNIKNNSRKTDVEVNTQSNKDEYIEINSITTTEPININNFENNVIPFNNISNESNKYYYSINIEIINFNSDTNNYGVNVKNNDNTLNTPNTPNTVTNKNVYVLIYKNKKYEVVDANIYHAIAYNYIITQDTSNSLDTPYYFTINLFDIDIFYFIFVKTNNNEYYMVNDKYELFIFSENKAILNNLQIKLNKLSKSTNTTQSGGSHDSSITGENQLRFIITREGKYRNKDKCSYDKSLSFVSQAQTNDYSHGDADNSPNHACVKQNEEWYKEYIKCNCDICIKQIIDDKYIDKSIYIIYDLSIHNSKDVATYVSTEVATDVATDVSTVCEINHESLPEYTLDYIKTLNSIKHENILFSWSLYMNMDDVYVLNIHTDRSVKANKIIKYIYYLHLKIQTLKKKNINNPDNPITYVYKINLAKKNTIIYRFINKPNDSNLYIDIENDSYESYICYTNDSEGIPYRMMLKLNNNNNNYYKYNCFKYFRVSDLKDDYGHNIIDDSTFFIYNKKDVSLFLLNHNTGVIETINNTNNIIYKYHIYIYNLFHSIINLNQVENKYNIKQFLRIIYYIINNTNFHIFFEYQILLSPTPTPTPTPTPEFEVNKICTYITNQNQYYTISNKNTDLDYKTEIINKAN